jgi:hypothetical protein
MRSSYRTAILNEVNAAKALAEGAEREERELTDTERGEIESRLEKAAKLKKDADAEKAFRAQMSELSDGLGLSAEPEQVAAAMKNGPTPEGQKKQSKRRTVGEQVVNHDAWKSMLTQVPNGTFSEKMRVQSQPMAFGGMKDLFYSGNREESAGFLVQNDNRGMLDPFYERPLSVRGLFASGNTTSATPSSTSAWSLWTTTRRWFPRRAPPPRSTARPSRPHSPVSSRNPRSASSATRPPSRRSRTGFRSPSAPCPTRRRSAP